MERRRRNSSRRSLASLAMAAGAVLSFGADKGFGLGPTNNTSVLTLVGAADGNGKSNLTAPINLGRVLSGQSVTTHTFTLMNSSAVGTDTLFYRAVVETPGLDASVVGTNPLPSLASTSITVGFSGSDTVGQAGTDITGTVEFENTNNTNDSNVEIAATAQVVTERFLDTAFSGGGTSPNIGEILVGATASAPETMFTTNPVQGDYSSNSLTTQTLIANGVATLGNPTTAYNSGTNTTYATIGATSPNFNQTFSNSGTGVVNFTVTADRSGSYGIFNAGQTIFFTVGTRNISIGAQFAAFSSQGVNIAGEGLQGENDAARAYGQWSGWQGAAIGASTTSAAGTTNGATIGNADSNDAIYNPQTVITAGSVNYGLRAGAAITSVAFNQGGWNETGFLAGTLIGDTVSGGTVIAAHNASSAIGTTNTQSATIGLDPTHDINGVYTANLAVTMENVDQNNQVYDGVTTNAATGALAGILGTSQNDLGVTNFPLTGTVNNPGSAGGGSYSLSGGSLVAASGINLTGSFTQTGGTSSFTGITGGGSINVSGGAINLSSPNLTGPVANNGSLRVLGGGALKSITGTGATTILNSTLQLSPGGGTSMMGGLTLAFGAGLDISNNPLVINYGVGNPSPITTLKGYIAAGYNNGAWNGPGIFSSSVAAMNAAHGGVAVYAVGYANSSDAAVAGDHFAPGTVVIEPAIAGDANLDGVVNFTDYQLFASNLGGANTAWDQGDFDNGGTTDFADFRLLAANFDNSTTLDSGDFNVMNAYAMSQGYTMAANSGETGFSLTALPEPGSIGIVGIASFLLGRRRRRWSRGLSG